MKRTAILITALALALSALTGCAKPEYTPASGDKTLSSLKCYVYYDPENPTRKTEVNLLSGTFNRERGLISYVFRLDGSIITEDKLSRCRIEATIPATAKLELTDEAGKGLGHGFEGMFDLRATTLFFVITAADGSEARYQLTCKISK